VITKLPVNSSATSTTVTSPPAQDDAPRIAVAIPCFNERAAIGMVIAQFRAALPFAEIVIFDNNSTDGSAEAARELGARVEPVSQQGKGHVVRTSFALLSERDVVVLVDGDGTYPAEAAPLLVAPVLEGTADMVVGARQPEPGAGAMSPVRGLGNLLIQTAFRLLFGRGRGDLLSGYRAFSSKFLRTVELRSEGFEIETELAIEAVTRKLETLEVSVPYRPRIAGTVSKLRAFRDGRRILKMILVEGLRHEPARVILAYCVLITVLLLLSATLLRGIFGNWEPLGGLWLVMVIAGFITLSMAAAWIHGKPKLDPRSPTRIGK
jgi:glycosyltransferase involved in cell wall biosynthesis